MPASDQGLSIPHYALIPRTLIFLIHAESVLLLRGAPHKRLWPNRYNGIGGHIERGEDVLTAAQRELLEETGISCPDLWLCGAVIVDAEEKLGVGIFVLRGELTEKVEASSSPEGTLEWVNVDKFHTLPLVEDLPPLLTRILATRRGEPPFCALSTYDSQGKLTIHFHEPSTELP